MSKPKMEVHEAIRKAITRRWLIGAEIQTYVRLFSGKWLSEGSITRRLRELKEPRWGGHSYTCRYLHTETVRRHEYKLGAL